VSIPTPAPATPPSLELTRLLDAVSEGNRSAVDQLLPVIYHELRALAQRRLAAERADHTLQATALVHEAYMKLIDQREVRWQNRAHFFGVAALAMRRILVNHAKSKGRIKRGGSGRKIELTDAAAVTAEPDLDIIAIDEAMKRLALVDERAARVVELRFFGGMNVEETAEALGIAPATVKRDWTIAHAWLLREIQKGDVDADDAPSESAEA
jgi:RNA polymerase sigma factor (TIGR02999 family)